MNRQKIEGLGQPRTPARQIFRAVERFSEGAPMADDRTLVILKIK